MTKATADETAYLWQNIPKELWLRARAKATGQGVHLKDVLKVLLTGWVELEPPAPPWLVKALKDVAPAIPSVDAQCHHGICSQAECEYCQRIIRAHVAMARAEGREL